MLSVLCLFNIPCLSSCACYAFVTLLVRFFFLSSSIFHLNANTNLVWHWNGIPRTKIMNEIINGRGPARASCVAVLCVLAAAATDNNISLYMHALRVCRYNVGRPRATHTPEHGDATTAAPNPHGYMSLTKFNHAFVVRIWFFSSYYTQKNLWCQWEFCGSQRKKNESQGTQQIQSRMLPCKMRGSVVCSVWLCLLLWWCQRS